MNKDQTDVSHIDKGEINEPVAVRYDFDGNGYLYMDAGSGSDWASRVKDCEFLYTHTKKELTDEEIIEVYKDVFNWFSTHDDDKQVKKFARAILKKASEK
jgi:hypothetical protein